MRYQNWDVLLFPGHSRIPVQEFSTACHVVTDHSSLAASKWGPSQDAFVTGKLEYLNKTPILTCFVSSLPSGTSFRISIHSWIKPGPSTLLQSRKGTDEPTAFQARVFVDGALQSTRTFREGTSWPEVIELKDGRAHTAMSELVFPAFHPEILQQPRWDPAEPLGRIQVVMTEGVLTESRSAQLTAAKVSFEGLRDIVAFAFQHAPQDVLEFSGIAWPNARMFENRGTVARRPSILSTRSGGVAGHEAHAHSPPGWMSGHREDMWSRMARKAKRGSKDYGARSGSDTETRFIGGRSVGTPGAMALTGANDPFLGPGPDSSLGWRSSARKTSTDEVMPDYASHSTDHSRADTDMSISWPRRDFQKHMDEAAVDEIIEALSPSKKGQLLHALSPQKSSSSGIQPPINTPTTAKGSQQGSPVETTPREGLSEATAGNSKQENGRVITTRSMKTMVPDVVLTISRDRSSSGSGSGSAKRKRSTSDRLFDQAGPAAARKESLVDTTPSVQTSQHKRMSLPVDRSSPDNDKESTVESRKSSASGGVLIDI